MPANDLHDISRELSRLNKLVADLTKATTEMSKSMSKLLEIYTTSQLPTKEEK